MQIFHAMKRADFCKNPQMALKPNMNLEVAQSKSFRAAGRRGRRTGRAPCPCCVLHTWVTPGENGAAAAFVYPPRQEFVRQGWEGYQRVFPAPAAVMGGGVSWPRCGAVRQLGGTCSVVAVPGAVVAAPFGSAQRL